MVAAPPCGLTVSERSAGGTPTATVGHLKAATAALTEFYVCGRADMARFRMIRVTGDLVMRATYFGR